MNSPECLPYKTGGDLAQAFATKTIHRTLNPVKSLKLNVSVGQSAQGDSLCEDKNPLLVDDKIKSFVPEKLTYKLHRLKSITETSEAVRIGGLKKNGYSFKVWKEDLQ